MSNLVADDNDFEIISNTSSTGQDHKIEESKIIAELSEHEASTDINTISIEDKEQKREQNQKLENENENDRVNTQEREQEQDEEEHVIVEAYEHEFDIPSPLNFNPHHFSNNHHENSWTDSIEAFLEQLNDLEPPINTSTSNISFLEVSSNNNDYYFEDFDDDDNDENDNNIKGEEYRQKLLTYFVMPVIISQLLMLIILSTVNSQVNSSSLPTSSINHHHHYYRIYNPIVVIETTEHESTSGFTKKFLYVFFNPFAAIYNNRYIRIGLSRLHHEYLRQSSDPTSFLFHLNKHINALKSHLSSFANFLGKSFEIEIEKGLVLRDTWNRYIYEKIYKIVATPQYQKTVTTVSNWVRGIKNRFMN